MSVEVSLVWDKDFEAAYRLAARDLAGITGPAPDRALLVAGLTELQERVIEARVGRRPSRYEQGNLVFRFDDPAEAIKFKLKYG